MTVPMSTTTGDRGGGGGHGAAYLAASAAAATLNYPLWRASAIGQSGFRVAAMAGTSSSSSSFAVAASSSALLHAFRPPYKGALATVLGMTWARAAIFWGSDSGKAWLMQLSGMDPAVATLLPPLVVSTLVQCVNMPLVRATITLQDPSSHLSSVRAAIHHIYHHHGGLRGLWHGTSAGILKSVPKYCTAIYVKDWMEHKLPPAVVPTNGIDDSFSSPHSYYTQLVRSAIKSAAAGIAGAALTNPLDVVRNEMFKTNLGLIDTIRFLYYQGGGGGGGGGGVGGNNNYNQATQGRPSLRFLTRGLGHNLVAVSVPVACTIFLTDAFLQCQIFSSGTRL